MLPDVALEALPDVANTKPTDKRNKSTHLILNALPEGYIFKQLFDIKMKKMNAKGKVHHLMLKVSLKLLSIGSKYNTVQYSTAYNVEL